MPRPASRPLPIAGRVDARAVPPEPFAVTLTAPDQRSDAPTPALSPIAVAARSIRKVFGATIAVNDVSFDIHVGETHALLGENGAGKSTLVKLLSGLILPTIGSFRVFGEAALLHKPRAAHAHGIQTAFQELTMVRDLTVLDNMLLPYPPTRFGQIRRTQARRMVGEHLDAIGLPDIDLDADLRDLDLNERQKIEIARALFRRPKILLLDEPTSTLSGRDIDWLGGLIAGLKRDGVTVVFISHRMREVRAFCDRVTVLRNGKHIATERLADVADEDLIGMIAGKELGQSFPPKLPIPSIAGEPVLAAKGLATISSADVPAGAVSIASKLRTSMKTPRPCVWNSCKARPSRSPGLSSSRSGSSKWMRQGTS